MKEVLIIIGVFLISITILFLYCSLVLAKESDKRIDEYIKREN